MSVEYWKARCKLAEDALEKCQAEVPTEPSASPEPPREEWSAEERDAYFENTGLRTEALEALRLLAVARINADESAASIVRRLLDHSADRSLAVTRACAAGQFKGPDEPEIPFVVAPLVERLLADLSSGRTTIEFLSRPPKMKLEDLPVGVVFVHAGQLYEAKREPLETEAGTPCFVWNRDERPTIIDRREMVSPLGKVVFDDRRKTIRLGLLEVVAATGTASVLACPPNDDGSSQRLLNRG